ncbi:hypothetical protein SAMN05421866_4176 [Chryseobacterium oranimense]|uniref:Uncharacterized protein n=1 Tax=Chryseobacterium oranimense TaxID=421058 RepID=A0A1M5WQ46_9FLAO|nr:hypothetical protein [Chryseobacterium oranimense]SHH89619.1 hypothetical protein SAMN05421866_4176 [Chryseobacterium oranimense]
MKTRVIILSAALTVLVISCKTDRSEDEELKVSPTSKVELKKLKINNKDSESSKEGDTIMISPPKTQSTNGEGLDPNEIIPPGDVKPPKP